MDFSLHIAFHLDARQHCVSNAGEALSVKVYADLINSMNFEKVLIFDAPRGVATALINNVLITDNHTLGKDDLYDIKQRVFADAETFTKDYVNDLFVLISPDAGSNKKIYKLSADLQGVHNVVRADKLRDVSNGKIIETIVYADDAALQGKTCVIIDDICSKGGTFCALAKVLKKRGADKVYLIVSHYESTANLQTLNEFGIDGVITTNSKPILDSDPNMLTVYDIDKYINF